MVDAKLNNLRIAPRKTRQVADMIRGKKVSEAEKILRFTIKRATLPITKLLNSAIANAQHNHKLKKEDLFIAEIKVDQGRMLKRWRPRSRGMAHAIQKKTSHISLKLKEIIKK